MPKYRDTLTDEEFDSSDLPIEVLHSPAGYYIGQLEPCGAPFSRLSDYYRTRELAEADLVLHGWVDRDAPENAELVKKLEDKGVIKRRPLN